MACKSTPETYSVKLVVVESPIHYVPVVAVLSVHKLITSHIVSLLEIMHGFAGHANDHGNASPTTTLVCFLFLDLIPWRICCVT